MTGHDPLFWEEHPWANHNPEDPNLSDVPDWACLLVILLAIPVVAVWETVMGIGWVVRRLYAGMKRMGSG